MNGKYIQKRRKKWYAVLEIPRAVRPKFGGKPRFVKSLETDSESVAERRAPFVIAAWKKEIAEARGEPADDDAAYWRRVLRRAKDDKERARIIEQIDAAAVALGVETVDSPGDDPMSSPEARQFYGEAMGWNVRTCEHLDEWQDQLRLDLKTKAIYKTDVQRFSERFKMLSDVTRPEVRRWVTVLLNEGEQSVASVRRIIAACKNYWRYLEGMHVVSEEIEPFMKLEIAHRAGEQKRTSYLPFTPSQVVEVLHATEDEELQDAISVAMWTGARIEEICSLKVEQVHLGKHYFSIEDAKTEAGWREVPIHPRLQPVLKRLVGKRTDGFVFAGMKTNKYGDRSYALGQRFSRLKGKLGYGPRHVFHSIRKTVSTQFEDLQIPEGVAADIIGHDKPTLTYGLYSGGSSMATKREAILKLKYPGIT